MGNNPGIREIGEPASGEPANGGVEACVGFEGNVGCAVPPKGEVAVTAEGAVALFSGAMACEPPMVEGQGKDFGASEPPIGVVLSVSREAGKGRDCLIKYC
jgi:hypothetical protein